VDKNVDKISKLWISYFIHSHPQGYPPLIHRFVDEKFKNTKFFKKAKFS